MESRKKTPCALMGTVVGSSRIVASLCLPLGLRLAARVYSYRDLRPQSATTRREQKGRSEDVFGRGVFTSWYRA